MEAKSSPLFLPEMSFNVTSVKLCLTCGQAVPETFCASRAWATILLSGRLKNIGENARWVQCIVLGKGHLG